MMDATGTISGSGAWEVHIALARLLFNQDAGSLSGNFTVSNGTLELADEKLVCTTGTFSHTGGIIVLNGDGSGDEARFKRSSSCP